MPCQHRKRHREPIGTARGDFASRLKQPAVATEAAAAAAPLAKVVAAAAGVVAPAVPPTPDTSCGDHITMQVRRQDRREDGAHSSRQA